MKARLRSNVDILDTGIIISARGKKLKMDEVEMEITKMFKDGMSFSPIKIYILKNYEIDKTEYQRRFALLLARLTSYGFLEIGRKNLSI